MPDSIVVSDTGPLISLEKLADGFTFIRKLYSRILVPQTVMDELTADLSVTAEAYLEKYGIEDLIEVHQVSAIARLDGIERLDRGEQDAITLALELELPLLIEENLGRQVAAAAGLHYSGIAGQVLKAFRLNLIDQMQARSLLDELYRNGRINKKLWQSLDASLG